MILSIKIQQNKLAVCKIIHTCLGWKQAVVLKERYKEIQLGTYNQIQGPISTRWLKIQKLDQGFDEKMAEKIMKNAEAARSYDSPEGALITILRKHKIEDIRAAPHLVQNLFDPRLPSLWTNETFDQ